MNTRNICVGQKSIFYALHNNLALLREHQA